MSINYGFYNLVTDGSYFYTSNTSHNVVCKINQNGVITYEFIKVSNPICLAITNYTNGKKQRLFVQTYDAIHVYEFDTPNIVIKRASINYLSSRQYPSMFHHTLEDKLYISNYREGTITTIDSSYTSTIAYRGMVGISGITLASNKIYFSNYDRNSIFFIEQDTVQHYINVNSPKSLQYAFGNFYICYGEDRKSIVVNTYGSSVLQDVFSDYLFNSVPINTLFFSNALYITLENSNVIYKNKQIFISANFTSLVYSNTSVITPSVIATNPACVSNPAFKSLIQLRTIGSNPNNPITPITTLVGREQGNNIQFNVGLGSDYESLKMRRKAETLKYRNSPNNPGIILTTKTLFANIVKNGGAYHFSKARLKQLLKDNNGKLPCDIGINNGYPFVITPPTNSGIHDSTFEGYYLNPYIPYYPSL
jgi:protein associated with RNAse G/E